MKKRLLSALLALMLTLTLLPTGVLATGPALINSLSEITDPAGNYKLAKNITVTEPYGSTTTPFTGTFDGGGHMITLAIGSADTPVTTENQAVFATSNGATIRNLKVTGKIYTSVGYAAGIVAQAVNSTIEYCQSDISITCTGNNKQNLGGVVAYADGSIISNCNSNGSISGKIQRAGGIVGQTKTNKSTIENCYNWGDISTTATSAQYIGGILGYGGAACTVRNCYNSGVITSSANAGSFAGYLASGFVIVNCYYFASGTTPKVGFAVAGTDTSGIIEKSSDEMKAEAFVSALGEAYQQNASGYPTLLPPDTSPKLRISGKDTIYVGTDASSNITTLTIALVNMEGLSVGPVQWSIEKKGGGSAEDIVSTQEDNENFIVSAVKGGVVTVTASVTIDGNTELITASMDISVIPKVSSMPTIANVSQPAMGEYVFAVGLTVEAKINLIGGGEWDYDNFPALTYEWKNGSTIAGRDRRFVIPEGCTQFTLTIKCGNQTAEKTITASSIRSADYGKLYPVAYDPNFPLPTDIKDGRSLTLLTSHTLPGSEVIASIAWSSDNPGVISADGTVTPPNDGKVPVKLTGRFAYGDTVANNDFNITVWSQAAVEAEASGNAADLQTAKDALGSWYKLYPVYNNKDTNVVSMVSKVLTDKGYTGIDVTLKNASEVYGDCGIDSTGKITYFYADPNGSRGTWFGRYDASFTLTKGDASVELTNVPVTIYWDVNKVKDTLAAEIIDKVTMNTVLAENSSKDAVTTNLTLPKVVDNKKWALISWTSSDPSAIVISSENQTTADMLFNPYVGKVIRGATDKTVTLTAAFTFQRANDLIGSEPPIVVYKTFTIEVKALDGEDAETARAALLAKLDAGFTAKGLRDYVTGTKLTEKDGAYTAANDIQFPTTGDYGVDGKYYPVLITSSDEEVIATSGINNAARVSVYRPLPGQPAKEVTLTVTIVDTTNGISASKEFTIFVQPLTQDEINAELVLMEQVKTHYFEGIKNANAAADQITGNLHAFQEAYLKDGELTFVYDYKNLVNHGIVPVAMDGWYDLQVWRLFKSSNPAVISHENLLVTRAENAKAVTITSALSSEIYGKYGERYEQDPEKYAGYAPLAGLYKQNVSIDLIVRGTKNPASAQPVVETLSVSFTLQSADSTWLTKTPISGLAEGSTVFDLFKKVLQDNGYTYHARGSYIDAITTPQGKTISELDTGANSGWMYKVNGTISSAYMAAHALKNGDNVVVFFTRDYTVETGYPGGGWNQPVPSPTKGAKVVSNGDGTYSATIDTQKTPAPGGVLVSIPNVPKGAVLVIVNADGTETIVKKSVILDGTAYLLLNQSATIKVTEASANFSDVTPGDWYRDAVAFAAGHQLFRGTSDSTFSPNTPMTRAMLVTVLYRLEDASAGQSSGFADVAAGAWYADATSWAAAQGIVKGLGNGSFVPDQDISRQQLVTILYRYAAVLDLDTSGRANLSAFSDNAGVAEYAGTPMAWAVEAGLIQGYNGTLSPEAPASRAEVAVILYRLMELIVQ